MEETKAKISKPIDDFLEVFQSEMKKTEGLPEEKPDETADFEDASESMALFYERVRQLIEYKDDHLIKRSAIERILKRNLIIEWRQSDFTGTFLNELAMAGYLTREQAQGGKREKIRRAISKYRDIFSDIYNIEVRRWLVSIAACEIEEILFPQPVRKALVRALFRSVEEKLVIRDQARFPDRDVLVYLSSLRSIMKVDNITLSYVLLKLFLPEWFQEKTAREVSADEIIGTRRKIEKIVLQPIIFRITAAIKRTALYFNIFYETVLRNPAKAEAIVRDPEALKFSVQLSCDEIYDREMKKFRKRVRRSLFFLVITKVLLAVFVEYPYARYILGEVDWLPIVVNLIFPPLFLISLSATVSKPSGRNSKKIAEGVKRIAYENDQPEGMIVVSIREEQKFSEIFLNLFFFLTFALSFGLAVWILTFLQFDVLAILIFLFLFSLVSFFSALVRQPIRDLVVVKEKEGVISTLLDTLFLPFVRLGKWMSVNFSRVNIFLFIFDVFIEAPFKVFVRFVQDWAGFIRRKKEEIV